MTRAMRAYPHKPDKTAIEEDLATALSLVDNDPAVIKKAAQAKNVSFFRINANQARHAAAYLYALEEPPGRILEYMRKAAQRWMGVVEVGAELSPLDFGYALSLALIAQEDALVRRFAGMKREQFSNPHVKFPESVYRLAELEARLASGAKDDPAAGEVLAERNKEAKAAVSAAMPQDFIEPMAWAIIAKDAAGLESAMQTHLAGYAKIFKKPSMNHFPESFLDVWGLGFLRLAKERGLVPSDANVYLPVSLLGV